MRHYYAQHSPYGILSMSEDDELHRFESIHERNRWVSWDVIHRKGLDSHFARLWYPKAFKAAPEVYFFGFPADDCWESDGTHEVWSGPPTGGSYETISKQ